MKQFRKICGTLAFLSVQALCVWVSALAASGCSVSCLVHFILPRREKEKAADGTGTSINGKRKSSI